MADKKQGKEQPKPGVKFQDQAKDQQVEKPVQPNAQVVQYKDAREQRELAVKAYNKVTTQFKIFTAQDAECSRRDTALSLKHLLDELKHTMQMLNIGTFQDKVQNYYLLYNATIYLFDICRVLRKSVYQSSAIEYLAFALTSMEANVHLISIKYLDWRVKLYIELAQIYFSLGSSPCALRTIEMALQKVQDLRDTEEKDPPLPDYIERSLQQATRNLRLLELKFRIQSGMPLDQWKKKVDEYFSKDPEGKCITIIESLRLSTPNQSNTIKQTALQQQIIWKDQLLIAAYEMLRPDMERVTLGLEQMMDRISKTVEFKQTLQQSYLGGEEDELKRIDVTKKMRDFETGLIKEKDWKRSALALPLEYQVELAHHAYDCGNTKIFEEVSESALKRCKYRRLETPYIVEVTILVSTTPYPNVPNGFEKIPIDLNEASLRMELKKLRNRAKNDQPAEKKEEKKDEKKDDKKKAQPPLAQQAAVDQIGMGVQATESELSKISHNYVFLAYKSSMLPQNAVYEIDVVMADEAEDPILMQGQVGIAIPIKQYTGVRETNKTIPYLIIKHSLSSLAEEEQQLSLVTDIRPLFGKNPLIRPDFGYAKIGCDLRQTPKEFIRSPNMDYLYLTYKVDRFFHVNEREVKILMHYHALEKTYLKEKSTNLDDDARLELDLCYDIHAIHRLIQMLGKCLLGRLGESFLEQRKDFLAQLVFQLWRKYIVSPLYQIDFIQQLRITRELSDLDYEKYEKWIEQSKQIFREGLQVFNQILLKFQCDLVLLCKINLSLSKLMEEAKDCKLAAENLRQCLSKIEAYRSNRLSRGVESQKDLFLPFSLTCSNQKIQQMVAKMKEQYVATKNQINRDIRIKQRGELGLPQLEADEENEEEYEILEIQQTFLANNNKDQEYFTELDKQVEGMAIDNTNLIISALHTDILLNIYRCELKAGRDTQKIQTQANGMDALEGLATSVVKKMSISKGPTAKNIKRNLTQLQNTLQKEGKIEPPKPLIQEYEKLLIDEARHNSYANCLLYMIMATNKNKQSEQKSLLKKSLEYLKEATAEEERHISNGISDSIFVISTLLDNSDTQRASDQFFPFKMLYNPEHIPVTQVPRKPILLARGSTSATFKLPPFKPHLIDVGHTDQAKKTILSMAIFGKVSANGVNVSLTSDDLPNTGTRQKVGGVVHISNLKPNVKYCFAVAGYDANEAVSNGIGETGDDICMLHPLPLPLLASYLAKTSYQLSHFEVAEEASDICIASFTEHSGFVDRMLDNNPNPLHIKRLVQQRLREVGIIEISNLTETLLIKARTLKRKLVAEEEDPKYTPAHWQKQSLKVCNFILLALETSISSHAYPLAKRMVGEVFNMIEKFLSLSSKPMQVFHILLKAQMVIVEIPKQYWDANLRILSGKVTYEILKVCMQLNEITLGKRVIVAELQVYNRKWYQVPKMVMVEEQQAVQNQVKKDTKKDPKKPVEQPVEVVPAKMVPKLVRELYESTSSVQDYLEETLLSMHEEFGEYVPQFIEKWQQQIDQLIPYVENPADQLERALSDLSVKLEFWECFKDVSTAFQKVQGSHKASPIYLEMLCKLFRRMLESGTDPKVLVDNLQYVGEPGVSEAVKIAIEIRDLQLASVAADIEFYPPSLEYLQQERETNKQGNDEAISIFQQYFEKKSHLDRLLLEENIPEYGIGSLMLQAQRFDRINLWHSEFNALKAVLHYQLYKKDYKVIKEFQAVQYCSVFDLDLKKMENLKSDYAAQEDIREAQKKLKVTQAVVVPPTKPGQQPAKGTVAAPVQLSEEDAFRTTIENVFKHIAYSCSNAFWAGEYVMLINQIKLLLNILVYEQVSPFVHLGGDSWKYLAICGMMINAMLKEVRKVGLNHRRKERENAFFQYPHQQSLAKVRILEQSEPDPQLPVLSTHLSKEFWFHQIKDLEMDLLANVQAYIIQSLMVEEKWNTLIAVSREFCNVTTHYYSIYILPFTVNAQQILLNQARPRRVAKEAELAERIAAFELWVQTKKKKTRSAILTQEVAPEELEFERDREELQRQIALLLQKEQFIQQQLQHSEKLIGDIQRDANQALESLKQARKMYERLAVDERQLWFEGALSDFHAEQTQLVDRKNSGATNDTFLKQHRKNHKNFTTSIISRYKLAIDVLKKRQEKFALVLALKELGNLQYTLINSGYTTIEDTRKQLGLAEEMWSDSLDTIFQRIYTIKQSEFRKMLATAQQPLAQTYGITQCLIGLNICATLVHYSYANNLHQQREAQILGSELVFAVFRMHLPNAMSWAAFVQNGNCEMGTERLFKDRFTLDPAETAISCERLSWLLIDRDDSLRALPLLAFLKDLARPLCSPFYTVRAMLLQALALSKLGCINEAFSLLVKVAGEKDLPLLPVGSRSSFWQSKTTGESWFGATAWQNSVPPYDEKHFAMTEQILKDLQLSRAFGLKYGLLNENLFNYTLCTLIYSIHHADIVEKWEINEQRQRILYKVDALIRSTLKKVGFDEDFDFQVYVARCEEQMLRLQGNESQANEVQAKRKEEIAASVKLVIQDPQEFEQQYNLLSNKAQVGLSNNEENLSYIDKRAERLHMIARLRSLLAKVNVSVGQVSRALHIYRAAIENVALYCFEQRRVEQGEEPENNVPLEQLKPAGMDGDKKGGKQAPAAAKDDKKQGKAPKVDLEEERRKEEERIKKEQSQVADFVASIVENRRTKRCINVFWWLRLRAEMLQLLYRHNRFKEALELIEQMRGDVKTFNDPYHQRIITEFNARILVKQGKFEEAIKKFEEAIGIAKMYYQHDHLLPALMGDFGELCRERSRHTESQQLFSEGYQVAQANLELVNYGFGFIANHNKKAIVDEKVQVCQDLQISRDAEEEITKKSDRLAKPGKKDEKKQDGKSNKKGPDKGQQKLQVQPEKPQMKVAQFNPLPNTNFYQTQKLAYLSLENDPNNSTAHSNNQYFKGIEIWVRCSLRFIESSLLVNPVIEDSPPPQESITSEDSSSDATSNKSEIQPSNIKTNFNEEEITELLSRIEAVIDTSYGLPLSFRLELYLLQARVQRRKFIRLLLNFQSEYFHRFLSEKNKKYRKFWERRPYRDLVRNNYFLDIPGFSQEMKEIGHNYLSAAKEFLKKAVNVIRGEAVLFEHFRKPEEVLVELAEVCLLLREYRPRIRYKHMKVWDIQKLVVPEDVSKPNIEQQLQTNERSEKIDQQNLELEAYSYLKYSIDLVQARQHLCEKYHAVGLGGLTDVSKMPLDVFTEIIEQDYICKKAYPPMLFEEAKKKVGVNAIDVLVFMQKTWRESRVMSFSSPYLQRFLSKIHRYLKVTLPAYQKCVINSFEVAPKNDLQQVFIDEGSIVIRTSYDRLKHEFKFIYILGALNKDQIKTTLGKAERDKILLNEEREVLYGNIYVSESNLSMMMQDALDLRSRMQESDGKSEKARERDRKVHQKKFLSLLEALGNYFTQKSICKTHRSLPLDNQGESSTKHADNRRQSFEISEGQEDLLDKYAAFIPELTNDNVRILIELLSEVGIAEKNHNYLVIFRYFHQNKYK